MSKAHVIHMPRLAVASASGAIALACGLAMVAGLNLLPAQARPLGQHCIDVGPAPLPTSTSDFCGCTWGAVYVNGQPVFGAQVTLLFGQDAISRATGMSIAEPYPIYALSGHDLGARYGDLVTVSVAYAGHSLTRSARLLPDQAAKEQQWNFAFEDRSAWRAWAAASPIRTLAVSRTTVWAGTDTGLVQWDTVTGLSTTLHTGLPSNAVRAVALAPNGDVWVGTPAGVAQRAAGVWVTHSVGLSPANITAIAIGAGGDVWVGAFDPASGGGVSRFDGAHWQPLPDPNGGHPNTIRALAVDSHGNVWAGTDEHGAARWDGSAWRTFSMADGLASDTVTAIAAEFGAVWFATQSYYDGAHWRGGISRFDLLAATWRIYTRAAGLANDDAQSLAIDNQGRKWIGTWGGGISVYDGQNWWTHADPDLPSLNVAALAPGAAGSMWAGAGAWLARYSDENPPPSPVLVQASVSPAVSAWDVPVSFHALATGTAAIASYEWRSGLDGVLGSEARFTMPASALSRGTHVISVRAQDRRGGWSQPVTVTLALNEPRRTWIPMTAGGP